MSDGEDPIFFTVIGAKDIEADAEFGTYVTVSSGTQMLFRTRSKSGESPQWNETHPINVSGPQSYSIAVHRDRPKANTLLGEITNIIVGSDPQKLTMPIELLTGGKPITITLSIRHSEDLILGDHSNNQPKLFVCLSNFIIKSLSDRHPDLPGIAHLSVAIVVNGNTLYETAAVEKGTSDSHWNCNGKISLSSGMIYTVQVINETASKRRLGFVQLDSDVLETQQEKCVRRKMLRYTKDDPQLEIIFTTKVLGHGISAVILPQGGGSTAHTNSGIPCSVLPLGNVFDSCLGTNAAPLSSELPSLSRSSSTFGGSNRSDIPSCQVTGSLSHEPSTAVKLVAVADQLLKHYKLEHNLPSLEMAISVLHSAKQCLPDEHLHRGFCLYLLGVALMYRYELLEQLPDEKNAIILWGESISLLGDGDPIKEMCIRNIGMAYQFCYDRLGDISDLQKAIYMKERAIELTPSGHPDTARYLNNLGNSYQSHFERLGEISILEKAISAQENAVELTPTSHPDRAMYLNNLGISYQTLFKRLGEISILEKAISAQENAVELTPTGHPDRAMYFSNLGVSYQSQFKRLGEISVLEKAISAQENAVKLTPTGHPDKATYLNNLGISYQSQFESQGEISVLEKAISVLENAVELTPDRAMFLNNLGASYQSQFKRLGEISVLEKAISAQENAVKLTPTGHPDKAMFLSNLGSSYGEQFQRLGEISDLEKAISVKESAVRLTPTGHPSKAMYFQNLGNLYQSHFERLGLISVLEKAISALENAVELTPTGHPDKAKCLSTLGILYQSEFKQLGRISALDKAISAQENALELTPTGHPDKAGILTNLGSSYLTRFERLGEISTLEKAISTMEDAVELTPTGHKAGYLNNLGMSYQSQFRRLGEISVLEKALSAQENAVELTPTGHPDRAMFLNNLGVSYRSHFEWLGEISVLEKAISVLENAVELTPTGHPSKPMYLSNLGISYQTLFKKLGEISVLEKAIFFHENAVELTPTGHTNKPVCLNNLASSYKTKFGRLGEISDLEKAISAEKNAVELTPTGHPDRAMYLANLGSSYQVQFQRLGEISNLEKAISAQGNALELIPTGHSDTAVYLNNLGSSYQIKFERLGDIPALEKAINCFSQASQSPTSSPLSCFRGAVSWAKCAEICDSSPIEAYDKALHLLPHVAWIGLTTLHRYTLLSEFSNVVHDAALAAISCGKYAVALEWLEQGRSIVWGQHLHLRTPVDELLVKEPELAAQLLAVSHALERTSAREPDLEPSLSVEQIVRNHHLLASQWDKLIQKVHLVPGFERFLHPKTVSQLMPAATLGPVIVISIHKAGCHALTLQSTSNGVIHSSLKEAFGKNHWQSFQQTPNAQNPPLNTTVVHIPLPNFSYQKGQDMQLALKGLCSFRFGREVVFDHENQLPQSTFEEILSDLWTLIVLPILDGLGLVHAYNNTNLPHIWWCLTGSLAFLPIHAAGLYSTEEPGHKLSEFAISSYTPTITALLSTQKNSPSTTFKIFAIAQESNPGHSPLPNTTAEMENLKKHAGLLNVKTLHGAEATVDNVVQGMSESTWVHLACHGTQNPSDPTKSAFILADGNLELSRITKLSLPYAEFAFLSACQTATGHATFQEEAVHLAAGMLMAGYRSVIATMWAIMDEDAPQVAGDVYAEILRNGQPDYTRAAYALHQATQNLRRRGAPFRSWVPFIHLGR